jgi:hypothetical protein
LDRVRPHPNLNRVVSAANALSAGLENPVLLVTLHRDLEDLRGKDGRRLNRSHKQFALRWAVFSMTYAAMEAFFNDVVRGHSPETRHLPLSPDKLRGEASKHGVKLFTNEWGVRTRTLGNTAGNRSRWKLYVGTEELRVYLADMKSLRDRLSHGADPFSATNVSGALWPLAHGRNSMRLMGAEGFIQACIDLASQTVLAYGGIEDQFPIWPEPQRSGLSAETRPRLPLLK